MSGQPPPALVPVPPVDAETPPVGRDEVTDALQSIEAALNRINEWAKYWHAQEPVESEWDFYQWGKLFFLVGNMDNARREAEHHLKTWPKGTKRRPVKDGVELRVWKA